MPRGRPPKPATLHWLAGDPSKIRFKRPEPVPPEGIPKCPEHLDAVAKDEWEYTTKQLQDMGLLSLADRTALALYCECYSRYRNAADHVAKYGSVILSPNKKYPLVSPYETVMRKSLKDCHTWLIEFGLTPAARARMRVDVRDSGATSGKWKGLVA
jgi:P27 family predicted phage terminase small subunit